MKWTNFFLTALLALLLALLVRSASAQIPLVCHDSYLNDRANGLVSMFNMDHGPTFPGGEGGLRIYLYETIRNPEAACRENVRGNVLLSMIIERDGSISDIRICEDIGGGFGAEAARAVAAMPRWHPGTIGNDIYRTCYFLGVRFDWRLCFTDPHAAKDLYEDHEIAYKTISPAGNTFAYAELLRADQPLIDTLRKMTDPSVRNVYLPLIVEKDGALTFDSENPALPVQQFLLNYIQPEKWPPVTVRGRAVRVRTGISLMIR